MTTERWLGTAYVHPDEVPEKRWANLMMERTDYESMVRERSERDATAPRVGEMAPDFSADRLDLEGKRTGDAFRLSTTRGRPVGLIFGSYT
jgi:hypothetical protein